MKTSTNGGQPVAVRIAQPPGRDGSTRYIARFDEIFAKSSIETVRIETSKLPLLKTLSRLVSGWPLNSRGLKCLPPDGASIVVCEHSSSAFEAVALAEKTGAILIYCSQNLESVVRRKIAKNAPILGRPLRYIDYAATRLLERRLFAQASIVTAITLDDCQKISELTGATIVHVPPISATELSRAPAIEEVVDSESSRQTALALFGSAHWAPKRWQVWELLEALDHGETRFEVDLIGSMPTKFAADVTRRFSWVRVVGDVAEPIAVLARYKWALAYEPLGGGFQMRLLDFAFAGTPVLTVRHSLHGGVAPFVQEAPSLEELSPFVAKHMSSRVAWEEAVRGLPAQLEAAAGERDATAVANQLSAAVGLALEKRGCGLDS